MSQCPFADFKNLVDPDTYAEGMPYEELARIRRSGPVHYMDDPTMGVPYWLITGREEIDYISRTPCRFSALRVPLWQMNSARMRSTPSRAT